MCSTPENWQAFELTEAYGIKEPKCPRQGKQISFELISYKVTRTHNFNGTEENGRTGKLAQLIVSLCSNAGQKAWKNFLAFP